MIQNNESIYNILPAEKIEYPKGPIYKSRYPGILPPTGSTFGTKNTTVPGIQNCGGYINNPIVNHSPTNQGASFGKITDVRKSIDPKLFMKKGEGLVCSNAKLQRLEIQKNQSAIFNNRYNKPLCQLASNSILSPIDSHKYKNKEPVPKYNEKPIYGLKSNKNYIIENSIANILSSPPIKNEKVEYTKKPDYGQIPSYLYKRKQQLNTEASLVKTFFEQEAEKNNHVKQVPDDEIKKLKAGLKEKWDEVNKKYQKYTYLNELDSLVKIRNKTGLEKQLQQLEKDMEKLNKKYIFIDECQ